MKKRLVLIMMAAVLAVTATLSLAACGPSPEDLIRENLTAEFESLKDPTSPEFQQAVASLGGLEEFGIDQAEFARSWFEGYDYQLGAIEVSGDTAVAQIELTIKQLGPITMDWLVEIQSMGEESNNTDPNQALQDAGDALMRLTRNASAATTSFEMNYIKNGNTWTPGAEGQQAMQQAMLGEMPSS
jgi:hypothetical protein